MEKLSRVSVQNTMLMRNMLLHQEINHLKVIDIRKDIRTRKAEERKRQEAERTSNGKPSLRVARSKSLR